MLSAVARHSRDIDEAEIRLVTRAPSCSANLHAARAAGAGERAIAWGHEPIRRRLTKTEEARRRHEQPEGAMRLASAKEVCQTRR